MTQLDAPLNFGEFSISLGVRDLQRSLEFYSGIGFEEIDGGRDQGWLMLEREGLKVGLFTFFETGPVGLSFNSPEVRPLVRELERRGYVFKDLPKGEQGPGHAILLDPDGNWLLFDQRSG